tara:strand:- start:1099 stop:2142 length:1044 start_codon:yes stop_codon:yes gene_type:complete
MRDFMRFIQNIFLLIFSISVFGSQAIGHAPIGVMSDHMHKKGESMISLKTSYMKMRGNLLEGNSIANSEILNIDNPHSNSPSKLSVIPIEMSMKMLMLGGMYAPSDDVTLMFMTMFMDKSMNLNTYHAMMRNNIGSFNSSSSDLSDVSFSVLVNIDEKDKSRWHAEIGLKMSIGDENEKGKVLTPMNTNMEMLLPYGMQSGDGSTSLVIGFTNVYTLSNEHTFGNQIRFLRNISSRDWRFGNKTYLDSWYQYSVSRNFSISSRLRFNHQQNISGFDSNIKAPVQTSITSNYGGFTSEVGLGFNFLTQIFPGSEDRLALELISPVINKKNGLQMKDTIQIVFGFQKSF